MAESGSNTTTLSSIDSATGPSAVGNQLPRSALIVTTCGSALVVAAAGSITGGVDEPLALHSVPSNASSAVNRQ